MADKSVPKSTAQKLIESFSPAQLEILGDFLGSDEGIECLQIAVLIYEVKRAKGGVFTGTVEIKDGKARVIKEEKFQ